MVRSMRELTSAEQKEYDKMILGSRQMDLKDFLNTESFTSEAKISTPEFLTENHSKILFTQMELFK